LFALASLKRLGLPRRGEVRLAVGADEETGGALGFGWLAQHNADFLKADLAICEGGGECLGRLEENMPVITVDTGEKGRCDVTFTARGEGGHASKPWGKYNPLAVVAEIVRRLESWHPQVRLDSPIFNHVGRWAGLAGPLNAASLERAIQELELRYPALGPSLRGQSRMTITPTMVQAGDKANAIPTLARLVCDARLLPGQTREELEHVAWELSADLAGVELRIDATCDPSVSDFPDELRQTFARSAALAVGGPALIAAEWCVGATDARHVRALGTPVYGFQLIHPDADPTRLKIHCIDESIEVGMLLPCALSLAHLALEFLEDDKT
jgi:acetylornithine deacetylase/succinyl-diaminopimelate desuccinylase-like protein